MQRLIVALLISANLLLACLLAAFAFVPSGSRFGTMQLYCRNPPLSLAKEREEWTLFSSCFFSDFEGLAKRQREYTPK